MDIPAKDRPAVEHPAPTSYKEMLPLAIKLENVHKTLGGRKILDGVQLGVRRGETLCIIGGSGQGKSVTLKHIVGLMKPDSGTVHVDGVDIARCDHEFLEAVRKKIGFLFQGAALLNSVNVYENVALPLREHEQLSHPEIYERVREVLSLVGMDGTERKMPAFLSGGMRKRVGLARALVLGPELMLYDEPTTGLDPIMSAVINELMQRTSRRPVTSVIVTHDMRTAKKVADRVVMLMPISRLGSDESQIVFDGLPGDLDRSSDQRVIQFVHGQAGDRLMEMRQARRQ
jgi:phospholipid/cholesterol/gamma-HCH transport system ATP-binding protein